MGEDEEGNKVLKEFWILPQVFEREILKGKDRKTFYPLLVKGGYIEQGCDGKNTRLRRPARQDSQRFIVVPIAAFDEEIV
jgi:cbb3-type cytochrome oxidase cytochrome c subunit